MKLFLIEIRIVLFLFVAIQISACTYTPWHRQQAEVFLNKGIAFIQIKQFNSAAKDLLEARKYSPYDHRIYYYLGIAYHGKGMRNKSIEEFKEAISLKQDYSEAHNYLGTLYSDMGLWDQAIEEFEDALRNPLYDTPAISLYNLGWAYYAKKNYQAALTKYVQALRKEPMTYFTAEN